LWWTKDSVGIKTRIFCRDFVVDVDSNVCGGGVVEEKEVEEE